MPHLSFETPCGILTVYETGGALIKIAWGPHLAGTETPLLRTARAQIGGYFAGTQKTFSLPLAPRGTDFQRRVWAEIARIPYGSTATYGGLAAVLGSSPRAVAGACARNSLPLLVPCHRVVAACGRLGGYSGGNGLDTKRALLRLEGISLEAD